jgi:nucleotide-binding universal stress UspA family protein
MPGGPSIKTGVFRKIMVAVDASERSLWAVEVGVRLAEELSAELALVTVKEPPSPRATELGLIEPALDASSGPTPEDILDRAQFHCPAAAGAVRVVRFGGPSEQIVAAAEQWGADLIVMGTHARGRLGRFLLGSTADAVVRRAACPVLTVGHQPSATRRPEEANAAGLT